MKDEIGRTAGAIWKALEHVDKMALSQLPKAIHEREAITYQALGWLAREDKVSYETRGKVTYIHLNHR